MDEALKEYLQSVQKEALNYENNQAKTKEYLRILDDIKEWLKEQCDADSSN